MQKYIKTAIIHQYYLYRLHCLLTLIFEISTLQMQKDDKYLYTSTHNWYPKALVY